MESKKIDDLTIEEIKEQMALYQRLYYHRMKEDPEYMERKGNTGGNGKELKRQKKWPRPLP